MQAELDTITSVVTFTSSPLYRPEEGHISGENLGESQLYTLLVG